MWILLVSCFHPILFVDGTTVFFLLLFNNIFYWSRNSKVLSLFESNTEFVLFDFDAIVKWLYKYSNGSSVEL